MTEGICDKSSKIIFVRSYLQEGCLKKWQVYKYLIFCYGNNSHLLIYMLLQ